MGQRGGYALTRDLGGLSRPTNDAGSSARRAVPSHRPPAMTVCHAPPTRGILVAAVLIAGSAMASHRVPDGANRDMRPPVPAAAVETPARPPVDVASWYGEWHHGRPTASGEPYDMTALTAAHRSLPLGSCVEVTNVTNRRRVFVRVNDRGPYVMSRTIDLSQRAAEDLRMADDGLVRVRIRRAGTEVCENQDTHALLGRENADLRPDDGDAAAR